MFKSRKFIYALFVIGALYALLVQQFFKNEGRFILQSPKYTNEIPYAFEAEFQALNLPINQDLNLHGIWFKHESRKAIVLLFPDSKLDLRQIKIEENHYYNLGFDILVIGYRGTSQSLGKLSTEEDLFSDAQNWYNFTKSQFAENNIIIAGQDFGCSIAAELAGNNLPKALILENPSFSFGEYQSKARFWWLPYSYFSTFPLNTWEYVRKTQSAVFLLQSETKRGQKEGLINYLKESDKAYWLKKTDDIPFSFQPENAMLFTDISELIFPFEETAKD